mmetsp:Transcript_94661/g.238657  ORF Transcript_94661/g.238657 Transcript_94661/m.238657 type:complete len:213 (+) Transcript_94661:574-1212(+)
MHGHPVMMKVQAGGRTTPGANLRGTCVGLWTTSKTLRRMSPRAGRSCSRTKRTTSMATGRSVITMLITTAIGHNSTRTQIWQRPCLRRCMQSILPVRATADPCRTTCSTTLAHLASLCQHRRCLPLRSRARRCRSRSQAARLAPWNHSIGRHRCRPLRVLLHSHSALHRTCCISRCRWAPWVWAHRGITFRHRRRVHITRCRRPRPQGLARL